MISRTIYFVDEVEVPSLNMISRKGVQRRRCLLHNMVYSVGCMYYSRLPLHTATYLFAVVYSRNRWSRRKRNPTGLPEKAYIRSIGTAAEVLVSSSSGQAIRSANLVEAKVRGNSRDLGLVEHVMSRIWDADPRMAVLVQTVQTYCVQAEYTKGHRYTHTSI